jgi:hypothetical protein
MNAFFKSLKSVFTVFGLFMAGLVVYVAVEDAMKRHSTASAATTAPDATVAEFLAITPRSECPAILGDSAELKKQIEQGFVASFEARGTTLNADQRQIVKHVIVPRLQELTVRSVDKAAAQGITDDEGVTRVILDDVMVNSPRYAKAMASILLRHSVTNDEIAAR